MGEACPACGTGGSSGASSPRRAEPRKAMTSFAVKDPPNVFPLQIDFLAESATRVPPYAGCNSRQQAAKQEAPQKRGFGEVLGIEYRKIT